MTSTSDSPESKFRHMAAALEATKDVNPHNELQSQSAAELIRFAFEIERRDAFPDEPKQD